jgi:phosphoribosylamine--glycine ligase
VHDADRLDGVDVVHAGTTVDAEGHLITAGGRVLAVTAVGGTVAEARARAYAGVDRIRIDGGHHRTDIAAGIGGAEDPAQHSPAIEERAR